MENLNSIKLSAVGADQVVRELQKVKKGFEETAAASKKISGKIEAQTGGGGGAGGSLGLGAEVRDYFDKKERDNAARREEANQRQDNNKRQGRNGGLVAGAYIEGGARAGQGFIDPITGDRADASRSWSNAAGRGSELLKEQSQRAQERATRRAQEAAANPAPSSAGGAGGGGGESSADGATAPLNQTAGGLKSLAPAGMGILGGFIAAGGVLMSLISTMAHKEISRAETLWGSGIAQRMSGSGGPENDYTAMRKSYLDIGERGVPRSALVSYFSAVGSSGGGWGPSHDTAAITAMRYGIDPGALGRTIGLRQQAGLEAIPNYMLGSVNVPQGLMTKYVSVVGNAVEEGMRRGFTGQTLENISAGTSRIMDAAMLPGGLTFTGAEALAGGIQSHFSGGSHIQSGKEALMFMMMKRPGEDFLDTMSRLRNPQEGLAATMSWVNKAAGDDPTRRRNMIAGLMGELPPELAAEVARHGNLMVDKNWRRESRGWVDTLAKGEAGALTGAGVIATSQRNIFGDVEMRSVSLLDGINKGTEILVDLAESGVEKIVGGIQDVADLLSKGGEKVPTKRGKGRSGRGNKKP